MRLLACSSCHAQYDVSHVVAAEIRCRCGEAIENRKLEGHDAEVRRCGACGALAGSERRDCEYCGAALAPQGELSLICPECYARNAEEGRFCTACGVGFDPDPVTVAGDELPCPVCTVLMPVRSVGGCAVNECSECNGLWAPGESFEALVRRAVRAQREHGVGLELEHRVARRDGGNPVAQGVVYRSCPVCDGHMQRRNFQRRSGIIIDWCRDHGTWLDADELEAIAGYILSGGQLEASGPAAGAMPGAHARTVAEQRMKAEFARILGESGPREPPEGVGASRLRSVLRVIEFFLDLGIRRI